MKSILIFEPWNLGDLVIAAGFARYINEKYNTTFSFICKGQWAEWLRSQNFIENVFTFEAPWARMYGKYNPLNYKLSKIYQLSRFLAKTDADLIWDVRGDIRHKFFLKAITKKKIYSIKYPKNINVYKRLIFFIRDNFKDVDLEPFNKYNLENIRTVKAISIFIDSYWPNKQLPYQKALELIVNLLSNGYLVKLIIPPNKDYEFVNELVLKFPNNFYLIKGSINYVTEEIKKSDLMISTDSGWMHMAYYYSIPCIALFGFDNHKEWAPPNTRVIIAENCLPKNERYKIKNFNILPLATINTLDIIEKINNFG